MATVRTLGALRQDVLSRCDGGQSSYWAPAEINSYLNASIGALWGLVTEAFEDYALATTELSIVSGTDTYALPLDFYKLRGCESNATSGTWITLRPFLFEERNNFAFYPASWSLVGVPNVRYRIQGSDIRFVPQPLGTAGTVRLWYIPRPPMLVDAMPAGGWPGYMVYVPQGTMIVAAGTGGIGGLVFEAVQAGTTGGVEPAWPTTWGTVADGTVVWSLVGLQSMVSTVLDTVARWDEYVILDTVIKMKQKEEAVIESELMQLGAIRQRIEDESQNRDAGEPQKIVDVHKIGFFPGWGSY